MQDPPAANIEGSKVHKFEHRINWGYVAVALAVVVVVIRVKPLEGIGSDSESYTESAHPSDG